MSQFQYVERLVGPACTFCGKALASPGIIQGHFTVICLDCAHGIAECLPETESQEEKAQENETPRRRGRPAKRS